jgi:hypothetical protein
MVGSGSIRSPCLAFLPPKHLALAPRGNHSGGSILAAKVAHFPAAVDIGLHTFLSAASAFLGR